MGTPLSLPTTMRALVIDRTGDADELHIAEMPTHLADGAEAHRELERGPTRGKIVLRVAVDA